MRTKIRSTNNPQQAHEYRDAVRTLLTRNSATALTLAERRALSAQNDTSGGFLAMPPEWTGQLIAAETNLVRVRQLVGRHYYPLTTSMAFEAPTVETNADDPTWQTETAPILFDETLTTGRRHLEPHFVARAIKVSNRLLRATAGNAENIVVERLAYKLGIVEEKAFLTGSGNKQPLGVFTPSDYGVPTSRDVSVALANVETKSLYAALMDAKYSLKAQYWPKAEWFLHRDVLKIIAKITDTAGRYIYEPTDDPNVPDMLLGFRINLSEYAPNTIAQGGYLACLGDFDSGYSISDVVDSEIKLLSELFADNNQTGVIVKRWVDGMPVLAEAFARVIIS